MVSELTGEGQVIVNIQVAVSAFHTLQVESRDEEKIRPIGVPSLILTSVTSNLCPDNSANGIGGLLPADASLILRPHYSRKSQTFSRQSFPAVITNCPSDDSSMQLGELKCTDTSVTSLPVKVSHTNTLFIALVLASELTPSYTVFTMMDELETENPLAYTHFLIEFFLLPFPKCKNGTAFVSHTKTLVIGCEAIRSSF